MEYVMDNAAFADGGPPGSFCWIGAGIVLGGWVIARSWCPVAWRSSPKSMPRSVSVSAKLERLAEELEAGGQYDEAMKHLLESHAAGSSRAGLLAHELSRRHPEAFEMKGCPVHQDGRRTPTPTAAAAAAAAAAATASEYDHDHDEDHAAAVTATADSPAVNSTPDVAADDARPRGKDESEQAVAGLATAVVEATTAEERTASALKADEDTDLPHDDAPTEATAGTTSVRGDTGTAILPHAAAPSAAPAEAGAATTAAATEEPITPTPEPASVAPDEDISSVHDTAPAAAPPGRVTAGEATAEETPWERGWHGPKDFTPPSDSAAGNGSEATTAGKSVQTTTSGGSGGSGDVAAAGTLRNFTVKQLNAFDGGVQASSKRGGVVKRGEGRPIYIALKGRVFDASGGRDIYGPGGEYSQLAGHDVSRRVARGLAGRSSRDGDDIGLDDLSLEGLDRFEKMTLAGWEDMFAARKYPVLGRVVAPPSPRPFSREELRAYDGRHAETLVPPGYAVPSIYMGVKDKIFDVSFGGSEFYVEGGAYGCLAGRDASRVLAKMSMTQEDVEGVLNYGCLTAAETKNLNDWVGKLGEAGKGYPVVGSLDLGSL